MRKTIKPVNLSPEMPQVLKYLNAEWKIQSFNDVIKRLYELNEEHEDV